MDTMRSEMKFATPLSPGRLAFGLVLALLAIVLLPSSALATEGIDDASARGESRADVFTEGWNLLPDDTWMYCDSAGTPLTGWQLINGKWYYLQDSGIMATGWQLANGKWYYLKEGGDMATGWRLVNDKWYYLNPGGDMATGWKLANGKWYYLKEGGDMATGWRLVNDKWYYLNPGGDMATGWKLANGKWYYLKEGGDMATGWRLVNDKWYYLNPGGDMATGWKLLSGQWYYLKESGVMATGVVNVNGVAQSFKSNGVWIGATMEAQFTQWAQPESSKTNWLILVDTHQCKVAVFHGSKGNWTLQKFWSCAPGKSSTPTVKGRFTVGAKGYYFDSKNARCFYYTQFYGDYLFHSVLYYQHPTPTSIMDGRLGMGLSHGCVRLRVDHAKWIYDNIPKGTKVYVW